MRICTHCIDDMINSILKFQFDQKNVIKIFSCPLLKRLFFGMFYIKHLKFYLVALKKTTFRVASYADYSG